MLIVFGFQPRVPDASGNKGMQARVSSVRVPNMARYVGCLDFP